MNGRLFIMNFGYFILVIIYILNNGFMVECIYLIFWNLIKRVLRKI